jgi:hypothetical protein
MYPSIIIHTQKERSDRILAQWLAIKVKLIFQAFEKTSTPFCPPKPKELEIAAPIFTARA